MATAGYHQRMREFAQIKTDVDNSFLGECHRWTPDVLIENIANTKRMIDRQRSRKMATSTSAIVRDQNYYVGLCKEAERRGLCVSEDTTTPVVA